MSYIVATSFAFPNLSERACQGGFGSLSVVGVHGKGLCNSNPVFRSQQCKMIRVQLLSF